MGQGLPLVTSGPSTSPPLEPSEAELQKRRESLHRGLRRASVASTLILGIVAALGIGFVWAARESLQEATRANDEALRANSEAKRAQAATTRAEDELWNARLSEARALRIAGGPGARLRGEALVQQLVQRSDLTESQRLALRQEAIVHLSMVDVALGETPLARPTADSIQWNATLTRYAIRGGPSNQVEVHEFPATNQFISFTGPTNAAPHQLLFSPDEKLLAVRYHGGEVRVWRLDFGEELLRSRCVRPPNLTDPLMMAPDSRSMAMFTTAGLAILPLVPGAQPRLLQPGRQLENAAFSPDSKQLAVWPPRTVPQASPAAGWGIEIWDVPSGRILSHFKPAFEPWILEWHPDGRRLLLAGDRGQLSLHDTWGHEGAGASIPAPVVLSGHQGAIVGAVFTPDGSTLITHAWDSTSRLWDSVTGQEMLRETRLILTGVSRDGARLVGANGKGTQEIICDLRARTGYRTVAWAGGPKPAYGAWLSPDARLLAVGYAPGPGQTHGEVRLWDFQRTIELGRVAGITAQFSQDSQSLFVFDFSTLRRHDVSPATLTEKLEESLKGEIVLRAPSGGSINVGETLPDGRTLLVAASTSVLWFDLDSRTVQRTLAVPAHEARLSRDGGFLATVFQNEPAWLRNGTNGARLARTGTPGRILLSPDGTSLAAVEPAQLKLRTLPSLGSLFTVPLDVGASGPPATAFTPDGKAIAVAHNRTDIRLIAMPSGRELATFATARPSELAGMQGIQFSKDGRSMIAARQDGQVVAWDLPVIRAELARIGLDWDGPQPPVAFTGFGTAPAEASAPAALAPTGSLRLAGLRPAAGRLALAAALLTLVGGLVVFVVQRRMLQGYAQLEALAVSQQARLISAREELLHSQKMRALGTLAAGIAHDFNNLLSVIRLSNQLAAEQTKPAGTALENVNNIESAVTQGEAIVQSMLGYSRAAAALDKEYALDAAVSETVAMLGRKFLSGIILKLELEPNLPPVQGSRGRFEQMLLNLIVNASDAMEGHGTLRIVAAVRSHPPACLLPPRPAPRCIEVGISDSGPGIPPEVLPRIFEPFFTTKDLGHRPGTGLGLATVYTMAEQEGHGLGVETREGQGTTFRIVIPLGPP